MKKIYNQPATEALTMVSVHDMMQLASGSTLLNNNPIYGAGEYDPIVSQ